MSHGRVGCDVLTTVGGFGLCWGAVAWDGLDLSLKALIVEPIDLAPRGKFDVLKPNPGYVISGSASANFTQRLTTVKSRHTGSAAPFGYKPTTCCAKIQCDKIDMLN